MEYRTNARPWIVEVLEPGQARVDDSPRVRTRHDLPRHSPDIRTARSSTRCSATSLPAWRSADFAERIDASLIVASTHGRTGLARLALGSVATEIVRHAPCPVVLSRPPTLLRESPGAVRTFGTVNA